MYMHPAARRRRDANRRRRAAQRARIYTAVTTISPAVADHLTAAQVQALVWAYNDRQAMRLEAVAEQYGHTQERIDARRCVDTSQGFDANTTFASLVTRGLAAWVERDPRTGWAPQTIVLTARGRDWAARLNDYIRRNDEQVRDARLNDEAIAEACDLAMEQ